MLTRLLDWLNTLTPREAARLASIALIVAGILGLKLMAK